MAVKIAGPYGEGKLLVNPETGVPVKAKGKARPSPDTDWTKWLLAGGAGVLGHQLTSAILDDTVDEEKRKKSVWMRLLATLAPLGVGGLGAVGAYQLAKQMGKNAQAGTNAVPAKVEQPKFPVAQRKPVDINDTRYDGLPTWRTLTGVGLGGLSAYTGKDAWKSLWENINAPKTVAPEAAVVADANANIAALEKRIAEANKQNARAAANNSSVAAEAQARMQHDFLNMDALPVGGKVKGNAVKQLAALEKIRARNAVPRSAEDIKALEGLIAAERARMTTPVPNAAANGFRRWLRPLASGGTALGAGAASIGLLSSLPSYFESQKEVNDARAKYDAWRALQGE